MAIHDEPKIDCHVHVFDPVRFPYDPANPYHPAGQEVADANGLLRLMDAHNVRHALVVGPNSGYGLDNGCLLDALARGRGRLKGIAVVPHGIGSEALAGLKASGIVGVALNATFHGVDFYRDIGDLPARLREVGMILQVQVEGDQLLNLLPLLGDAPRLVIDHCGRPDPRAGLDQPGFQALLALGRAGQAVVKLSGFAMVSRETPPHRDIWPYLRALLEAFTAERCVWASDWPFLRATERIDYGPLLALTEALLPDAAERRRVMWETPRRVFGF